MILFALALVGLMLMGLSAPFESLGWWAGWYGDRLQPEAPPSRPETEAEHFVVYLTGIGGLGPEAYSRYEHGLLQGLKRELPDLEIVDDLFPYSASNQALTGQRVFAWFYRRIKSRKEEGKSARLSFLVNLRNLWQVLVSSDDRFGPLYNMATAEFVYAKLLEHGYPPGSGLPVSLIGYSGGGQIAVGCAPLLKNELDAPVYVVSLGGVMSANRDLRYLDGLTHLYGSRDHVQRLGYLLFPQRWPFLPFTVWNKAREKGLIRRVPMGDMVHTGKNGYLDPEAFLENGQSHLDKTLQAIGSVIREQPSTEPAPPLSRPGD